MTRFRPCIDIHDGKVKQIVGGTLDTDRLVTNFESEHDASWFAELYKQHDLTGAHVILLGQGCQEAAIGALRAWPNGLQVGGGINDQNAKFWIEQGASHVILTSWLFDGDVLNMDKVRQISSIVGKTRLVLDLSCRRVEQGWRIATNRWRTITQTAVNAELIVELASYCDEFLVHAADVEGLCSGMDEELIQLLGQHSPIPVTYAGGASKFEDLAHVQKLSQGRVNLTIGSALDLFGGSIPFTECVKWNQRQQGAI